MIGILLFFLVFGTGSPQVVFVDIPADPMQRPSSFPSTIDEAQDAIGWYGAACLAGDLSYGQAAMTLGTPPDPAWWQSRRTQIAAISRQSGWPFPAVLSRATNMLPQITPAWIHVLEAEAAGEAVDDSRVAPLLQHQSDCQDHDRARLQLRQIKEQEALAGLTNVEGLLSCAALTSVLSDQQADPALVSQATALRDLAARTSAQLDPPLDIAASVARNAAFFADFFATDTRPDGSYSDPLQRYIEHCDTMIEGLRESDLLP